MPLLQSDFSLQMQTPCCLLVFTIKAGRGSFMIFTSRTAFCFRCLLHIYIHILLKRQYNFHNLSHILNSTLIASNSNMKDIGIFDNI